MNGDQQQTCIEQYGSALCMEARMAGLTPEQYIAEQQRQQEIQAAADAGMMNGNGYAPLANGYAPQNGTGQPGVGQYRQRGGLQCGLWNPCPRQGAR